MLFVLISYIFNYLNIFLRMRVFINLVENKGYLLFNKVKGYRLANKVYIHLVTLCIGYT